MGAGLEIASCCDMRVAGDTAKFGRPSQSSAFRWRRARPRVVMRAAGELTAREMLLSAAVLGAAEMKLRGFLNQVVPADEAGAAAMACVERSAILAPGAASLNKQAFRALAQAGSAQAVTDLTASAYRYAASPEHREGVTAFTEKRPPRFDARTRCDHPPPTA